MWKQGRELLMSSSFKTPQLRNGPLLLVYFLGGGEGGGGDEGRGYRVVGCTF